MAEEKTKAPAFEAGEAIYDATKLGTPRMVILGLQHMFAMFGATVLVPLITGLDVSTTLLFAGLGTLLFHFITKMKVPAFLGSSFAFLGGYAAITGLADENMTQAQLLPYACFGVACAGLVYLILAAVIRAFGTCHPCLWYVQSHEILPAGRHRSHHHRDRPGISPHSYFKL